MGEFVVPDKIHQVGIEDGFLNLSPAYDTIHRWGKIGFSMLKYFNCDVEPPTMSNVPIDEAGAQFLIDKCGLGVVPRPTITEHEHEIYVAWSSAQLEEQFGDPEA